MFSLIPLEVAKALDTPLLAGVPSSAALETVVHAVGGVQVRYGKPRSRDDLRMMLSESFQREMEDDESNRGRIRAHEDEGGGVPRRKLVTGLADGVAPPDAGVQYTGYA